LDHHFCHDSASKAFQGHKVGQFFHDLRVPLLEKAFHLGVFEDPADVPLGGSEVQGPTQQGQAAHLPLARGWVGGKPKWAAGLSFRADQDVARWSVSTRRWGRTRHASDEPHRDEPDAALSPAPAPPPPDKVQPVAGV
jgi:hypothetical protein